MSHSADHEIRILKGLTEHGCSCTPKLLDYCIVDQTDDEYVPGGYIVLVLMEKLPGRNLTNFPMFPLEKRDEVRIAFGKAIRYDPLFYSGDICCLLKLSRKFHTLGYWHGNADRRNVLWDEENHR